MVRLRRWVLAVGERPVRPVDERRPNRLIAPPLGRALPKSVKQQVLPPTALLLAAWPF